MTEIPVLEFTGVAANLYLTPGKNSDSAILLCNRKRRRQIQHALYSFFFFPFVNFADFAYLLHQ